MQNSKIYHLSHTDLDGYGCQFVTHHYFNNIEFFNANYGKEVKIMLERILTLLKKEVKTKPEMKYFIFITDLNLTPQECQELENNVKNIDANVEILLLDHHASGETSSRVYSWYHLDTSKSASLAVLEFCKNLVPLSDISHLNDVIAMVNSIDIWQEDGYGFEFGKVALELIVQAKELNRNMFDNENRNYKFELLKTAYKYLQMEKGEVEFDNDLRKIKKEILGGDSNNETLSNVTSNATIKILKQNSENLSLRYRNYTGILTYNIGGISVLANAFLRECGNFDFFLDISNRGNVSLRANNKMDVSLFANEIFNGGGHKNASGGKVDCFKELYFYDDVRSFVQKYINSKTESRPTNGIDISFLKTKFEN